MIVIITIIIINNDNYNNCNNDNKDQDSLIMIINKEKKKIKHNQHLSRLAFNKFQKNTARVTLRGTKDIRNISPGLPFKERDVSAAFGAIDFPKQFSWPMTNSIPVFETMFLVLLNVFHIILLNHSAGLWPTAIQFFNDCISVCFLALVFQMFYPSVLWRRIRYAIILC